MQAKCIINNLTQFWECERMQETWTWVLIILRRVQYHCVAKQWKGL